MMVGYSILGFSVEVITYSFEVCRSFKEIYITIRLSRGWPHVGLKLTTASAQDSTLFFPKVKVRRIPG